MEPINKYFEEIKKTEDPEEINNFLIKLSKSPRKEYLSLLEFFIITLKTQKINRIKLNLIYLLGEIGKVTPLSQVFLEFILNTYYTSDRWTRNEVIQTIGKIYISSELSEDFYELIGNAVNDEYTPISKNALKILLKLEQLPNIRNLFQILNSRDPEIVEYGINVLIKFIPNSIQLFKILNTSKNYEIFKKKSIRVLLIFYFKSLLDIEPFRDNILNSAWENKHKEMFLKEIDFFERISLKKI